MQDEMYETIVAEFEEMQNSINVSEDKAEKELEEMNAYGY